MVGRPVLTSPPTSEPISLTLVKQMLRIDAGDTSQDTYLTLLISTARETAEKHTTRGYMTQSYREYYDGFPGHHLPLALVDGYESFGGLGGLGRGRDGRRHHHHYFELSRSPLQVFTQLQYLDLTGATQTLDPSQYVVNDKQDPCQVTRAPELLGGLPWPIALREVNSVWIDYTVGYGANFTASIAASASVLTSVAGYTFTANDVGSPISIAGAGAAGAALVTTIASVAAGVATLAANAVTTVPGAAVYIGNQILFGDTQAMLMLIVHWEANRLPIQQGIPKEIDYAVKYLLDKDRVYYQP